MQYLDLPASARDSLLRGFLEKSWLPGVPAEHAAACDTEVCDARAYEDGRRLRRALDAVGAAISFDDLNSAEDGYDAVARDLNSRWGAGLVVTLDEGLELGIRGFRGQGLVTTSDVLVGDVRIAS